MRDAPLEFNARADEKLLDVLKPKTMLQAQVLLRMVPSLVSARPWQWVSYSRSKTNGYKPWMKKYNGEFYTYRGVVESADLLDQNGLVINQKTRPGSQRMVQSRMQATPELIGIMQGIEVHPEAVERLVMKDADGELTGYSETDETAEKRRQLQQLNEFLESTQITLIDGGTVSRTNYRRIFNRGDWQSGGRFYGPPFQQLSKVERQLMLINGEPSAMLDYSAHHIRMLYNERGLVMPGEPYALPGFARDEVKVAVNTMLNAETPRKAVQAIGTWMAEQHNRKYARKDEVARARLLYDAIVALHAPIADAFGSDCGVTLQFQDSEIIKDALTECGRTGIPAIGLHDEIDTQARHAGQVVEIMIKAFGTHSPGPNPAQVHHRDGRTDTTVVPTFTERM